MTEESSLERRLVAVMATDVAGYSRLMQSDEAGTLAALGAVREMAEKQIAQHHGRIANAAGDSVLAEFTSAVDAVSCALILQELLIQQSQRYRSLQVRIGIHLGDVVNRGGDVFGTAVNIAARLEGIAQPGGTVVSAAVRDAVLGKLPAFFTSLGAQQLKNIDEPLQAYSVASQIGGSAESIQEADRRLKLTQSDDISIAVLPLVNLSSNPEHEFLVDGLTEDLITELSRLKHFLVIARNTVFTYKGRAVDVSQVARDLGVRYVLEGSVRSLGSRVRITAQLIDAKTGTHLWAEKFDRDAAGMFDIQDEVVRAVAASTQTRLMIREGETAARSTDMDRWALTARAWAERVKFSPEGLGRSEEICRQLVSKFPTWSKGHSMLSSALYHEVIMGFRHGTRECKDEIIREAKEALRLDPNDEYALQILAMVLLEFTGQTQEPISLLHRSLDVNPNCSVSYGLLGDAHLVMGQPDEAIRFAEIAIRLNPRDPGNFYRFTTLAEASFLKQDHEKTLHWANQTSALKPDYFLSYALAAASLALRGDMNGAKRMVASVKECWPDITVTEMTASIFFPEKAWDRFSQGMIAAGIPP